ncbi:hypothetical protein [Alienimonas sp. DA493]|uniref:hypothetical protein n=1 Tax=Alienimonas sp. DA493 TaxID=3373605 RepID=UPI00375493F4
MIAFQMRMTTNQVTKAVLNRILRETNREAGDWIVEKILPAKFEVSAYHEGTAEPRTRQYVERKRKKVGHNKPLVYSGETRRFVLANARVTATANRGRVKIKAPFPMPAKMRQELEAVSPRQSDRLADFMVRTLTQKLEAPENQRKRRRRNSAGQSI